MADFASRHRVVHVDFGTGDGAFVQRLARERPDTLVIGVDAHGEGLREVSRRAAAKPARGGLANALFGRLPLDAAPGELVGLADALTILLPWGQLLRAVALPDAAGLARLRALCKPGATIRALFGYGPEADGAMVRDLALPNLASAGTLSTLEATYAEAAMAVRARHVTRDDLRALSTSWAKKLAFSCRERVFVEVTGLCMES